MATWRYMEPEEVRALAEMPPVPPVVGDAVIHIFEVVDGSASPLRRSGDAEVTLDVALCAPQGWFARVLDDDEFVEGHTYEVTDLEVKMNGQVVEMKHGTRVVFLPPNYRELADEAP